MLLAKKSKTQDIMSISIPPDEVILTKAYKLVVDKEIRIVDLVNVILKDPAITLKILKTGNQSATLNGQQETISLSSAITRLGFDSLKSILFGLQAIKNPKDNLILKSLNNYRYEAVRISDVSNIIAKYIGNKVKEPSRLGGLFLNIGYILLLLNFKEDFLTIEKETSQALLKYELEKKFNYDVEKITLKYLRRNLIPDNLVEALNRDAVFTPQEKNLYLIRAITQGAKELINAFDRDKLNQYKIAGVMPAKSYLRTLPFTQNEYGLIYNEVIEYLVERKFEKKNLESQAKNSKNNINESNDNKSENIYSQNIETQDNN